MAFSMSYSEYIWRDGRRDIEAVYANELIYMVKKLSLVCNQCFEFRVLFQSSKIFDHVNRLTAFWSWGQIRVRVRSRGKT